MKLNEHVRILGDRVILIPYEAHHVPKYYKWMQCPKLQRLTASEPLTLVEEYEMQRSWREDEDKCTFLILCRETYERTHDDVQSLVGDTNLFLQQDENNDEKLAEAEIMIAEPYARSQGYGREAMLLMLRYGVEVLKVQRFEVKIVIENTTSLRLFEKILFKETERSQVFKEVTLSRSVTKDWIEWLNQQVELKIEHL